MAREKLKKTSNFDYANKLLLACRPEKEAGGMRDGEEKEVACLHESLKVCMKHGER